METVSKDKQRMQRVLDAAVNVWQDLQDIELLPSPFNWASSWLGGTLQDQDSIPQAVLELAQRFTRNEAELKLAMDLTQETDLGLDASAWETDPNWVKSTPLFESSKVSMRLFVVPPYQLIPLHDHPQMAVYSRLYRGDLHVFSMSWTDEVGKPGLEAASNRLFASCDLKGWLSGSQTTFSLSPVRGNLHELHAGADTCVILDVFVPPYNGTTRTRQFYSPEKLTKLPCTRVSSSTPSYGPMSVDPHHLSAVEVGCVVKLKIIPDPHNYRINRLPYIGPCRHFATTNDNETRD